MVRIKRGLSILLISLLTVGLFSAVARAQATPKKPVKQCSDVAALQIENTIISSGKPEPEGTSIAPMGPMMPPIPPQPAHCIVEGEINKHTGADGNEYGDKFELRLPDAWNGRFLFQGGGGLDGILNPAVGIARPGFKTALARGYAVVSTDGAHRAKSPMALPSALTLKPAPITSSAPRIWWRKSRRKLSRSITVLLPIIPTWRDAPMADARR